MYAFVDVEQYQIVGTGQTINEARNNYRKALNLEDVEVKEEVAETSEAEGIVESLADAVVGGNTCYYFTLEGDSNVYTASVEVWERLPFMKAGDRIRVSYSVGADGKTRTVTEVLE